MRKGLFFIMPALIAGQALAEENTPINKIKELAALDRTEDSVRIFDNTPTPLMQQYFSPSFNQAWTSAMKHNKDFPVFDADPLTGTQSGGGIKSLTAHMEGPTRVVADETLQDGSRRSVEFRMQHTPTGEWLINDIVYLHQKSLRVVLDDAGR